MSVKLDISESLASYQEDLMRDLRTLESEINSISLSLNVISKQQILKIENLISDCENNVNLANRRLSILK